MWVGDQHLLACVFVQGKSSIDATGDGAPGKDLSHHSVAPRKTAVLRDEEAIIGADGAASIGAWHAPIGRRSDTSQHDVQASSGSHVHHKLHGTQL